MVCVCVCVCMHARMHNVVYMCMQVSQSAVDYVVHGASTLVQKTLDGYRAAVFQEDPSVSDKVNSSLPKNQLDPFIGLTSAYLQMKFIEEHFPYVVSNP